jgi:ATP-dependent Clp protease ATP-binding subunit ClpB
MELSKGRLLDAAQETKFGMVIRQDLEHLLIGQPAAVNYYVQLIEKFKSNLFEAGRPIGAVLLTGPTGSGKTYSAESFSESLQTRIDRSWKKNMMRIDCGEFQHSHEIAKLVGSPPGYLGHRETKPMLCGERVAALQSAVMDYPLAILVFDEIEKASDGLWNILLGILDKASLSLGTNEQVDLQNTIIIMTSNAGFSDRKDGLGFLPPSILESEETKRIGIEAAKRKFSVEFINRLDGLIAFNALTKEQISQILKLELGKLQLEVFTKCTPKILFAATPMAQAQLLKTGYDSKYNARNIKRTIDAELRLPMARILGSGQVMGHEGVLIDFVDDKFTFRALPKDNANFVLHGTESDKEDILSCIM